MKLLDSNIIIRFLTRDHKEKAEKCKKLLEKAIAGKVKLLVTDLAIAEIIWVLEKYYKCANANIRSKIEAILNTPNLMFQNKEVISESIVLYDMLHIDYIDVYHAVLMRKSKINEIYSYDKHFDLFEDIKRVEP